MEKLKKLNKALLKQISLPTLEVEKTGKNYKLHAEIREIDSEKILVLDAYAKKGVPDYRIFIGQEDYISLNLVTLRTKGKYQWNTSLTFNLLNYSYYGSKDTEEEWINPEDVRIVKQFFNTQGSPIKNLRIHEEAINRKRLEEKDRKILDKVDAVMKQMPTIPEDFTSWIREEAFYHYRFIFYNYSRKTQTDGFCTHCGENVTITNPRHNQVGQCPNCNSKVILKAAGKAKYFNGWRIAALIQKFEKGFVVRKFDIHLKARKDEKAEVTYFETERCIYPEADEFKKVVYHWGTWKQRKNCWLPPEENTNNTNMHLYYKNLNEVFANTIYQYSALEQLAAVPGMSFGVHGFISQYPANRYYEYFIKSNLTYVVRDLTLITYYQNFKREVNMNGKKAAQILGIEKYDIPVLVEAKAGTTGLHYIRECRKKKIKLVPEQIRFVEQYFYSCEKEFLDLLEYTTPHKAIKYLKSERGAVKSRFNTWMDYIDLCKKLRYDMTNSFLLFPKHLHQAHDAVTEEYNKKQDADKKKEENKKYKKISQMQEQLNKQFYMEYKDLFIRAPKEAAEIIEEGHTLHHCVAGYTSRVAAGQTVILFLRKKDAPDTPYFTVEVKNNEIYQYHGKYNDANKPIPKEIHQFIKKFKAEKLKKNVKERVMVAS